MLELVTRSHKPKEAAGRAPGRWMSWVLDESAKPQLDLPWKRTARRDWKTHLSGDAVVLQKA